MTSEPNSRLFKCDRCDWTSQEPLDAQVLGTDLRNHMFHTHQVLLSNAELAKYIYQPGDRVSHDSHGAGTVLRELTPGGYIAIKFDRDMDSRTRNVTPRHLSHLSQTPDADNPSDDPLSQNDKDGQISPQGTDINQVPSSEIPGHTENTQESDNLANTNDQPTSSEDGPPGAEIIHGDSSREVKEPGGESNITEQPTAQEDQLSESETQSVEEAEKQAEPTPATPAGSASADEPRQAPSSTENPSSPTYREAVTVSGDNEPPSDQNSGLSSDFLMPNWVVFCIGIGECGTKIIRSMNKKPEQLPSRNPVYYPVHCSQYDTHDGSKKHVENRVPQVKTNTIRATEAGDDFAGGLADDTAGVEYLGVGGKPYASYLSFKRIFDHAKLVDLDEDPNPSELKQYDADYFVNPLWRGQNGKKIGPHEEIRLSGDINFNGENVTNYGLITFNAARGGTGSGGVSLIHNFIHRRSRGRGRRLSMGLSLNVSVLPDESEKDAKDQLPGYAVSSFYRLSESDIHGVVLASNVSMIPRNKNNKDRMNDNIREMLVPIIVSPTGKYTVSSASSTTDQADISKAIASTGKGLCVIGFAKESLPDGPVPNDLMSKIAENALDTATCDWIPRSGAKPTGYRAFLSGPPNFFNSEPSKLTSDLLTALNNGIRERSKKSGHQGQISVNGDVSVQAFAQGEDVRLSVLLYNVKVPEFDELVKKGFDEHEIKYDSEFDGWDQILNLTEEQVARMEGGQVGPDSPPEDPPNPWKINF